MVVSSILTTFEIPFSVSGNSKRESWNLEDFSGLCRRSKEDCARNEKFVEKQLSDLEEETSKLADRVTAALVIFEEHKRDHREKLKLMSNKAWAKNQSNDTTRKNLPNHCREVDAPLQCFGMEIESLIEDEWWFEKRWWTVGLMEEHGWRNGHEEKPNENIGRNETVVWWVELVILHMLLLNDVQKIVVVPQIQYTAVCDATTSSPKLQVCSETVDIGSKSMEWSMFLSWCRGSFTPFKTKKNLSASLNFVVSVVFSLRKNFFEKLWNTFFSFMLTNVFCVCSLLLKSLLWFCSCLLKFSLTKNKFLQKSFFWWSFFFGGKKLDVHLSRPHGEECRQRIRVAMMCDDACQQRLRTAEERLAPAASAARAETAQEGKASPARVEVAQESRDEEMNDACVTNNAEDIKPRVEILREDSMEVTSRMEDGTTPVGGPLESVESRSEGVPPLRKRGSEEGWLPEDAMLEFADVPKMCVQEMTVIFESLDLGSRICFCEILVILPLT